MRDRLAWPVLYENGIAGVPQRVPSLAYNGDFALKITNTDSTVIHDETSYFEISDRVSIRFFAGRSLVDMQ